MCEFDDAHVVLFDCIRLRQVAHHTTLPLLNVDGDSDRSEWVGRAVEHAVSHVRDLQRAGWVAN